MVAERPKNRTDQGRKTVTLAEASGDRELLAALVPLVPLNGASEVIRESLAGPYPLAEKTGIGLLVKTAAREQAPAAGPLEIERAVEGAVSAQPDEEYLQEQATAVAWAFVRWWVNVLWDARHEKETIPVRLNNSLLPVWGGLKETYADLLLILADYGAFELTHVHSMIGGFSDSLQDRIRRYGDRGLSLPQNCVVRVDLNGYYFQYLG